MTTVTVDEIRVRLSRQKYVSRRQVYRYLSKLNIKPVGVIRTSPRRYPADAVDKILNIGLGIPTMAQLADLRRRAMAARPHAPAKRRAA